jgi:hypothetical protein
MEYKMGKQSLLQKLQIKSKEITLIQAPALVMEKFRSNLPDVTLNSTADPKSKAIIFFITELDEVNKSAAKFLSKPDTDAVAWIAYPKRSSKIKTDVNRDRLSATVTPFKWRPVRLIALDDCWSAMRFMPA